MDEVLAGRPRGWQTAERHCAVGFHADELSLANSYFQVCPSSIAAELGADFRRREL